MTIHEFFMSDKPMAIHCDTRDKAHRLLKLFHESDYRWHLGQRYIDIDEWESYGGQTCYSNKHRFASLNYYEENDYIILNCDDFVEPEVEQAEIDYSAIASSFASLISGDKI